MNQQVGGQEDLGLVNNKKRNYHEADITIPADHRLKMNESGKLNKLLDFASMLKKLWEMKVKVILIVIETLGTLPKNTENRPSELKIKKDSRPSRQKHF